MGGGILVMTDSQIIVDNCSLVLLRGPINVSLNFVRKPFYPIKFPPPKFVFRIANESGPRT